MMNTNSDAVEEACADFQVGLKNLTHRLEETHIGKACLVCDRLLEWNDTGTISVSRLKVLQDRFVGEVPMFQTLSSELKQQYTYRGDGREPWMKGMFLSPRGYYRSDKERFQCCTRCVQQLNTKVKPCRVVLPRFAIANGAVFGEPPVELTDLNDTELLLISTARPNKHIICWWGDAHKSMRGWHNLYGSDVEGAARTLN